MSTTIGHFEILSELAKSATGTVYKVNDPQSGQTVALKAICLSAFGDKASALQTALIAEAESTKSLSSPNIVPVLGAGEIDGQFCATMDYVQGNSISTMLARKEGFSIWDLLDIGRQVCAGLDHAFSHGVFHYSLEPAKIMCGWDGTVKILGYGLSSAGRFIYQAPVLAEFLGYMSPEQFRGEAIDARSNVFSLGAMFYEMVTESKAFEAPDLDSFRHSILKGLPVPPAELNPKIHPALSDLIMKALDKDPGQRYQSAREMLDDLEKCKESKPQAAAQAAPAAASPLPAAAKAAAGTKFTSPPAPKSPPAMRAVPVASASSAPSSVAVARRPIQAPSRSESPQRQAASQSATAAQVAPSPTPSSPIDAIMARVDAVTPQSRSEKSAAQLTLGKPPSEKASAHASPVPGPPSASSAAAAAKLAVDPMMAESAAPGRSVSFSEIMELPPLKDVYVEAPPPVSPKAPVSLSSVTVYEEKSRAEEKEKMQPREAAQKAIKEIKNLPPRLILYSLAGAFALILVIGVLLAMHVHNLNSDEDSGAAQSTASAETSTAVQPSPSVAPVPAQAPPQETTTPASEPLETAANTPVASSRGHIAKAKKKVVAQPAPVVVPGQLVLDSTPQGAQAQIDGRTDSSYVTPFLLPGLSPGQHTITVTKAGYSSDTRTVEIASGNKTALVMHLAQLMATLSASTAPAGANIYVDGRDTGKITPAQVSVDKGSHVVLMRKPGFIDETSTAQFVLGQTVSLSPTLRPLGNADSIKTVGKFKKLFGGAGAEPGQITVSIKTQPKGAQVTVNQHMLEKGTPVEVAIDPGNYVIDITLSGFASIHKVITAEKGSRVVIDEQLQRE
ncbi:MAG TPA: PEGA domain-containing protein [Candidatus Sulfotelmatobacter sp.]